MPETTFKQYMRLVQSRAFRDFGWGRDLLVSTALASCTAFIQLHWNLVPSSDKWVFIVSIIAPYVVWFGIHLLWRCSSAKWKVFQEREIELNAKISKVEAKLSDEITKQDCPKLILEYSAEDAEDFMIKSGLTVRNCGGKPGFAVVLTCEKYDKVRLRFDDMPIQSIDPNKRILIDLRTEHLEVNGIWHSIGGTRGDQIERCFEWMNGTDERERMFVTITYADYDGKKYTTPCVILREVIPLLTKRIWCELVQVVGNAA